ncbi:MAG: pyruvate dehydrogenase complex dihydrolipoamide acetyltransferase [Gemmatimonadota bacterium]
MATKVVMAQLSPTMEEGRLLEWKVKEGDRVEASDLLAEIETDKANMDIEALKGGVVRKLLVEPGATVPVGAIIGILGEPDEDISELLAEAEASLSGTPPVEDSEPEAADEPEAAGEPEPESAPAAAPEAEVEEETAREEAAETTGPPVRETAHSAVAESSVTGRIRVSPVARRMAESAGLELGAITGTGPGGRIVKTDVEKAIADGTARAPAAGERHAAGGAADSGASRVVAAATGPARLEEREIDLSMMRKSIAKRLTESIGPVPHFFLTAEIDMGRALEMRKELNERIAPEKVGVNDLLVKATAEALARHPEINASWEGDRIRRHGSADIGIAVAVEDGLITPVLRDADRKGLVQISRESADLVERARERKLTPEEYQGATFSVSNLGMFEIDEFTAIINPPEAGIFAVGSTIEKPVVVDGEVAIRKRMRVTMSCDHRVIDGATGARFLRSFRAMLENPLEMVL